MLYSAERIVLIMCLLAAGLFLILGVPFRDPWELYWQQMSLALYFYPFALATSYLVVAISDGINQRKTGTKSNEKETWQKFRSQFLTRKIILRDLRLINAIMIMFVAFAHLKHLIPLINPNIFDAEILSFETSLLGGKNATAWMHSLLGIQNANFWSFCYSAYYGYVSILCFVMILQRDSKLAHNFCELFILTWFIGTIWIYLTPTWGPCFFDPSTVSGLPRTDVSGMQHEIWKMKLFLDSHPKSPHGLFLISGLPSLHFAVTVLGSVLLKRINLTLSILSWIFVLMTFITTIYFGWHYLLDDLTALILVAALFQSSSLRAAHA